VIVGKPDKVVSIQAPTNAAIIAGGANFTNTFLSAFRPTRKSLNMLLAIWTIAVIAIAVSMEKNIAKAGINMVPSPNPENNVRNDAINAVIQTIRYIIT
jgi:hypothetical protein